MGQKIREEDIPKLGLDNYEKTRKAIKMLEKGSKIHIKEFEEKVLEPYEIFAVLTNMITEGIVEIN
ncbi:MAG: hypothetical protein ACP6IP_10300 [Candidatus Njordarchaeia archaeon]